VKNSLNNLKALENCVPQAFVFAPILYGGSGCSLVNNHLGLLVPQILMQMYALLFDNPLTMFYFRKKEIDTDSFDINVRLMQGVNPIVSICNATPKSRRQHDTLLEVT